MAKEKITTKQRLFVKEYLVFRNAAQAAIKAGYSKRCAKQIGNENLTKPYLALLIAEGIKKLEDKIEITNERILNEWALLAFSDAADFFNIAEDGQVIMKPLEQIPEGLTRCIESIGEERIIKETADGKQIVVRDVYKYKFHSKTRALEALTRHRGLYPDQRISVGIDGAVDGEPIEVTLNFIHTNGVKPKEKD